MPKALDTLATDVGAVSLLREVATLDETSTESLSDVEPEHPLPLDSSEPSEDPDDSKLRFVSASLLTLILRTSFMLVTEEESEASALWAEATREM